MNKTYKTKRSNFESNILNNVKAYFLEFNIIKKMPKAIPDELQAVPPISLGPSPSSISTRTLECPENASKSASLT